MNSKIVSLALAGILVLAACGESSSGDEAFDVDRACRIGQRLVDETASGDRDGVVNQIERLAELDGIDDSALDVDDLDQIAEDLDANAVEDLIAEFDALGCDLDEPDVEPVTTDEPVETVVTTTVDTVPATEPPPETAPATDPPATDPPATDPPAGTTPPEPPPTDGATGIPIDVGSSGPGTEAGVNRPTENVIADFEMEGILYSPNTNVVELSIDRSDASFGGEPEWSSRDSITMSATTSTSLEDIRAAYKTAIEGFGVAYDFTESTSTSDGVRNVGLEASPTEFDTFVTRWDIVIGEDDELAGVVAIEISRSTDFAGAIPPIPGPARDLLADTAKLGTDLGWTITSYRLSEAINSFSGGTFQFGSVRWDISEENTMVESADALKAALGGGPFDNEEADDESVTWFLPTDESPLFSVRYSEFTGTTASFTT